MAGAYLMCKNINRAAGSLPAEVGIVRGGLFYERLGATFGERGVNASAGGYRAPNGAVQAFKTGVGEILFALTPSVAGPYRVWQYDGIGTWSLGADTHNTGVFDPEQIEGFFHVTGSDGAPYLVIPVGSPTNQLGMCRWDGTSWVTDLVAFGVNVGHNSFAHRGIVHMKLHRTSAGSWEWLLYDVVARTLAFSTVNPADATSMVGTPLFFALGGRLFMISGNDLGGGVSSGILFEFVLGSWIRQSSTPLLANVFGGLTNAQSSAAIRIADDKVLILCPGHNGGTTPTGMRAILVQIVAGVPTLTDVTDPVVPPFLRPVSAIGTPINYGLYGITDNDQTPGTPEHNVFFCTNMDTDSLVWNLLRVTDELSEFQVIDSVQNDNAWAAPQAFQGGGEHSFIQGELHVEILDTVQDAAGLRIDYQVDGDVGPTDKTVQFRFVNSFGIPVGLCTLVPGSATGGGTVVGNQVTGLNADPTIAHTVVWDFLSDGVTDGSQPSVIAELIRP